MSSCCLVVFSDCGAVSEPDNGNVLTSGTWFLDTATFSCNAGYQLDGDPKIECGYDGQWNGSSPVCTLSGM